MKKILHVQINKQQIFFKTEISKPEQSSIIFEYIV